jgi:hypothetical protein
VGVSPVVIAIGVISGIFIGQFFPSKKHLDKITSVRTKTNTFGKENT